MNEEPGAPVVRSVVAPNPGPMTLDGTRSWLIGSDRLLLLDPGPRSAEHLTRLRDAVAGRVVDAILLTHAHADHAGGAAAACAAFGAPLLASSSTLSRTGLAGRVLRDGDDIDVVRSPAGRGIADAGGRVSVRVIETPGHSADHLCYLLLPHRWLFTGDLVLGEGSSAVLHPDGRMDDYLASLRKLEALKPVRLLPAHGPPVEDAADRLAEYRAHRRERERQIARAVEDGARTVAEIRSVVYGPLPHGLAAAAEASISAHLVRLRAAGRPVPDPGPGMFETFGRTAEGDPASPGSRR